MRDIERRVVVGGILLRAVDLLERAGGVVREWNDAREVGTAPRRVEVEQVAEVLDVAIVQRHRPATGGEPLAQGLPDARVLALGVIDTVPCDPRGYDDRGHTRAGTLRSVSTIEEGIELQRRGDWDKAIEVLPAAIEAARAEGNETSALEGQLALAAAQLASGDGSAAHETYTDIVGRAADYPALNARAYFEFGMKASDPALVDWAVSVWNGIGDDESLAWGQRAIGSACALRGDDESAALNYQLAIPTLRGAVGTSDPRLLPVFDEVVAFYVRTGDADAAKKERERAFIVACINHGPAAPVTLRTAADVAAHDLEMGLRCYDQCIERAGTDHAALAAVFGGRAAAVAATDPAEALRNKETALVHREQAFGVLDHGNIPLRTEIHEGWNAHGDAFQAEQFLVRCRERTTADTWLYRNLTIELGYTFMYAQRRDEYAQLWRDFIAAREALSAPDSEEVIEALELAGKNLPHYAPPEELFAVSERLLAVKVTRAGLNALAKAYRMADRRDEARATWKRAIDQWIVELGTGTIEYEEALGAWSNDYGAYGSFPADGPPNEAQLAAVAVYDDAIPRAVAVVGDDQPGLAKVFLERGNALSTYSMRTDEALADLTRARTLFERVEGPHGENVCFALYLLSEYHDHFSPRPVAIAALRETIEARLAANIFEAHYDRARLAQWLVNEGQVAEALAIREQLVTAWAEGAPSMVSDELKQIVHLHLGQNDLAAATATCERFATLSHHFGQYDRYHAVDGWWYLCRAKCDAGDLDGARAAVDAIAAQWSYPEVRRNIQERADDARDRELPIADYFREQVQAQAFAGIEASRELESQLAPTMSDEVAPVLADALIAAGDPRGELIVVQQKLASAPDDSDLLERQRQMFASNRLRLLGPLEESHATWRLGYWKTLELPGRVADLRAIVEHPSARYLEAITFRDTPRSVDAAICEAAELLARIPSVQMTPQPDDYDRVVTLNAAVPTLAFRD